MELPVYHRCLECMAELKEAQGPAGGAADPFCSDACEQEFTERGRAGERT